MANRSGGTADGAGRTFALVISRFNEFVTRELRDGAIDCLEKHGMAAEDVHELWVPGAFEIPHVAKAAAESGRFDAVICLGAVIRGETPHFDFVAGECARGISNVSTLTGVPAIFGVLTTDTAEQAMERAGGAVGNKGWDAALAALEMVSLLEELRKS
jgi:6,7-dimethyl-8-ribityllumazine synthase